MAELTDAQRRTISALADTFVAAVPPPPGSQDADGFFARTGTQAGAAAAFEITLDRLEPALSGGLLMLVDAFAGLGFADVGAADREGVVGAVAASGPEAALGVQDWPLPAAPAPRDTASLPNRLFMHHRANPEFQPTRHANRV